jgi:SAM-dependent methyltransferase
MVAQKASDSRTIFEGMSVLGDAIRCRLLLVLERYELSVTELCSVLQLPQSTVSRHLKLLSTAAWVEARRDGTSRLYSVRTPHDESSAELWRVVREELLGTATAEQDLRRVEAAVAHRRTASKAFFSSSSRRWAAMRRELFGQRFDLEALLALLGPELVIGDLGAGTGQVVEMLAPYVASVVAVDESAEMLEAASDRLIGISNVELRHGALESLPIDDNCLDVALLMLVLHHLPEPQRVLAEVERVLRPAGRVLIVDMLPHEREEYRNEMGHVWLGFEQEQIFDWLEDSRIEPSRFSTLTVEPDMLGPPLFVATGSKESRPEITEEVAPAELISA